MLAGRAGSTLVAWRRRRRGVTAHDELVDQPDQNWSRGRGRHAARLARPRLPGLGGRTIAILVALTSLLSASAPGFTRAAAAPIPGIATLGPAGGWSWFTEPRAVADRGRTFVGWIDPAGRVVVGVYGPRPRAVASTVVATRFDVDDHNNPAVHVHRDGRVSVFWTAHNGRAIHLRTTTVPGDLDTFGPRRDLVFRNLASVYTYANPVYVSAERRLYLFFRAGFGPQGFATSDDDGRTWTRSGILFDQPGHRPYGKYSITRDGGGIAVAYTHGHPRNAAASVYYAEVRGGVVRDVGGRVLGRLGTPLRPTAAQPLYDSLGTGRKAWVWDVAQDRSGRPVVLFATFGGVADHRYHYARWTGTRWHIVELTGAGASIDTERDEVHYSGGLALDHTDPAVLYLSRQRRQDHSDIERWQTLDGGATWRRVVLTAHDRAESVRPVVPRNVGPGVPPVLWMRGLYRSFTNFRTSIVCTVPMDPPRDLRTVLRISSPPRATVARGEPIAVRGRLLNAAGVWLGNREVTLLQRPLGLARWHRVIERRTDRTGEVGFAPAPMVSTEYAIEWPGNHVHASSLSRPVQVLVR